MNKDQQLAEAIIKKLRRYIDDDIFKVSENAIQVAILPLIADFKKEVAGEAWDAGYDYDVYATGGGTEKPDRETYINSL